MSQKKRTWSEFAIVTPDADNGLYREGRLVSRVKTLHIEWDEPTERRIQQHMGRIIQHALTNPGQPWPASEMNQVALQAISKKNQLDVAHKDEGDDTKIRSSLSLVVLCLTTLATSLDLFDMNADILSWHPHGYALWQGLLCMHMYSAMPLKKIRALLHMYPCSRKPQWEGTPVPLQIAYHRMHHALTVLELQCVQLSEFHLERLERDLGGLLKRLRLNRNGLSDLHMVYLNKLERLTELDLTGNLIGVVGVDTLVKPLRFSAPRSLHRLQYLSISVARETLKWNAGSCYRDVDQIMTKLDRFSQLERFTLDSNVLEVPQLIHDISGDYGFEDKAIELARAKPSWLNLKDPSPLIRIVLDGDLQGLSGGTGDLYRADMRVNLYKNKLPK